MDRTYLAVQRQLGGMKTPSFEVGIRDAASGKMMLRDWEPGEVLKSVPWLKQMNFKGSDIYIRPAGSVGLVLLDDLTRGTIERMKADGLTPAAVIETSPLNFQSWVRVSEQPIEENLATRVAKILAARYGGDANSADWRHFGRLAGFTNRKPQYAGSNGYPFVLAHECNGRIALEAEKLTLEAREFLLATHIAKIKKTPSKCHLNGNEGHLKTDPVTFFQKAAASIQEEFKSETDFSRLDWMIARQMIYAGFDKEKIIHALEEASPELETRKSGHVTDYVHRTVSKAFDAVALEQQEHQNQP